MSRWGFRYCNITYDTILESLGPWQYSEIIFIPFDHHQDDQEGQEGLLTCIDVNICTFTYKTTYSLTYSTKLFTTLADPELPLEVASP